MITMWADITVVNSFIADPAGLHLVLAVQIEFEATDGPRRWCTNWVEIF